MTELEWMASEDPQAMLRELEDYAVAKIQPPLVSGRKLRLFAVENWRAWSKPEYQVGYVDSRQGRDEIALAAGEWIDRGEPVSPPVSNWPLLTMPAFEAAMRSAAACRGKWSAALLRDLFGNPWRPVTLPVDERGWYCPWHRAGSVARLARAAYDQRREVPCGPCMGRGDRPTLRPAACPYCHGTGHTTDGLLANDRLGVLSDAIEEAGCDDQAILGHLRSDGMHAMGCWCVDLILGKS